MSDVLKTIKGNYNFEKFKRDVVVDTNHCLNFRCTTCLAHDRNSWRCRCLENKRRRMRMMHAALNYALKKECWLQVSLVCYLSPKKKGIVNGSQSTTSQKRRLWDQICHTYSDDRFKKTFRVSSVSITFWKTLWTQLHRISSTNSQCQRNADMVFVSEMSGLSSVRNSL